jgi:twitching motility protein PilT
MRAAMRQDPDVILVGEIRDAETLKAALAAAETGHLVRQVRLSLAAALRGIIGQRLVRRAGDGGRIAVLEVLVNTGRTAEAIADPERLGELGAIMTEGGYYGMQTFDQHLWPCTATTWSPSTTPWRWPPTPTTCGSRCATRAWSPEAAPGA